MKNSRWRHQIYKNRDPKRKWLFPMFGMVILLGLCPVFAQETQLSNSVSVMGVVGDMTAPTANPTSGVYGATITVGQPFIGGGGSDNYSTDLGIWSFYLKEPDAPLAHASDGDVSHPSFISIMWEQDVLSPRATGEIPAVSTYPGSPFPENKWRVTRDGVFRANVSTDDESLADVQSIFPGQLYSYGVKVSNQFGVSNEGFDIGFTMPNGKITGRVFTPGPTPGAPWTPTGNPVADVEVSLSPILGKSLDFNGVDNYAKVDSWYDVEITTGFSVEMWFNIDPTPGNATLFDMGERFQLNHTATQLSVIVGTQNLTVPLPSVTNWHHAACTVGDDTLKLYLDGVLEGTLIGVSILDGDDIRIGKRQNNTDFFKGYLDDIRVWNYVRLERDIVRNKQRALFGNEIGLVGYWKLDEGVADISFDMTPVKESMAIFGASWSETIPEIKLSAFTDTKGKYEIRGIWYDASNDDGTSYTVTPYKKNHAFFSPASEEATISRTNPEMTDIKFLDESMFTASGYLVYGRSTCPVEGVEILVDSASLRPQIFTDEEGKFTIDFEPNTGGIITPIFGGYFVYDTLTNGEIDTQYVDGHVFELSGVEQGYTISNIEESVADINFVNVHTEQLSGTVTGGTCGFALEQLSKVIVEMPTGCYTDTAWTDASGFFEFLPELPPLNYYISVVNPDSDIEFQTEMISVIDSGLTDMDFVYRAPIELEFSGLPTNDCGTNVVHQFAPDSVTLKVFERYGENICPLENVHCQIIDEFSEMTYEADGTLSETGTIKIYFTPKEPNILSGGDYPYQKMLEVTVSDQTIEGRPPAKENFWAYVTGEKSSEANQFTTFTSEMPWFVLRVPPGDGSYTYFSQEQSHSTNFSMYKIDADGNQTEETLHLGFDCTVIAGFGVAVQNKWSLQLDAGHGWTGTKTDVSIDETNFSFTRSETYNTSGDELVTGDDATVFVGGGLNLTFGIATRLSFDEECEVFLDTTLITGINGFNSTYMYSKYYIKNVLIPNIRIQMNDENYWLIGAMQLAYWNDILEMDSIAVANAVEHEALKFGTGEQAKNISFDAGASFEYSATTDSSFSSGTQVKIEDTHEVFGEGGFTINAFGLSAAYAHTFYNAEDETNITTDTRSETIGFVLDDDDPGDAFTVDVLRDTVWGMPVFKILGGQSSCPWEKGTMKRQAAQITLDTYSAVNVLPDEAAVFTVYAGNSSETGDEWDYIFEVMTNTNPHGAVVKYAGMPMTDPINIESIPPGAVIPLQITVERGPTEYDYEGLQLRLAPACEIEVGDKIGYYNNIDFAEFDVHFVKPCSEVEMSAPEDNWVINQSLHDTLDITLFNYDTACVELAQLKVEYSKINENNWIVGMEVDKDSLMKHPYDYISLPWDVGLLADGEYKIRGMTECELYDIVGDYAAGYTVELTGIIDRRSPKIMGVPEPSDEILGAYDQIVLTLDEPVNCDEIYPGTAELYFAQTGDPIASEISCDENRLIITPATSVANREIENQRLKAEVHFLKDLAGNTMEVDTLAWEFVVDRNPVHWNVSKHEQVVYTDDETIIPIELTNNGSSPSSFDFGNLIQLPEWVTPTPYYGQINPGGSLTIFLHVDPYLNLGDYVGTVYAETPEGDEPLELTLHVMCKPPEWDLRVHQFQFSMLMTVALSVKGDMSIDEYDRVGAFVGDECRGFAQLENVIAEDDTGNVLLDTYIAFLTIYSNLEADEEIQFRIWDNSNCHELWEIEQTLPFVANDVRGTPAEPFVLNATGAIAQEFNFEPGWTWFSLNLDYGDMSFDHVLNGLNATSGDRIIMQEAYAQYSEEALSWAGPLAEINFTNTKMYQADMKTADEFPFIGYVVDPEEVPIYLVHGWNWIGYTPQVNLKLNEAIATLSPSQDDVIKSQFGFAQYDAVFGWLGNLSWMEPGRGYMMRVANNDTLIYPFGTTKGLSRPLLAKSVATDADTLPEPDWSVNARNYPFNMTITALLESDTISINDPADVLVAMSGREVRGVSRPVYIPELNAYRIFIMVYGEKDEDISFIIYDTDMDITYRSNESMPFGMNDMHGTLRKPFFFTKAPLHQGDKGYIPEIYSLSQNFPNPFNPTTKFGFGLPEDSDVRIRVYNILGQEVKTLVHDHLPAGYRFILWNGTDNYGRNVTSGVYIAVMESKDFRQVRKMVLMK